MTQRFDDERLPRLLHGPGRRDDRRDPPASSAASTRPRLLDPQRSAGGHRRYSRHQLQLAARVRELLDQGTALDAACRIVTLEDQLDEARRTIADQRS